MRGIAVELSLTPKLQQFTQDITFAGSPIRLFLDNELPVTICSFRGLFLPHSRVEVIQGIVRDCGLSVADLLRLLANGFRYNFQGHAAQQRLLASFWERSKKYLNDNGVHDLFDVGFHPRTDNTPENNN
eukprot:m51a1_g3244 adenosine deaminase, putative (129) ;mRNA; f:137137-137523